MAPLPPLDRSTVSLPKLVAPMLVENLIRTSLMAVDQFMLYGFDTDAAAAMSGVNQLAFFIQLLYTMVAVGASILISQNLGAGRRREAGQVALGSMVMVAAFSVVLSALVAATAGPVIDVFALQGKVRGYALSFLTIYGGASTFMAINIVQAAVLRAYGHSKDPMAINVLALGVTIAGNYIALYGPFGLPVLGMAGVALSNVLSQVVAFAAMFLRIRARRAEIEFRYADALRLPGSVYRGVLEVGVPTAGENLAYNLGQLVVVRMIAGMGAEALAAYGLTLTISRYVFIGGISIGSGAQIKVGYLVGAGKEGEAQRRVYRWFLLGFAISLAAIAAVNLAKPLVIPLFTADPVITGIAAATLLAGLVLEPARNFNTIIIPSLKGAGDVRFPVLVGMVSMWGVGVLGAYVFGVALGMGLPGIWLGLACDEWLRGLTMLFRWRSGRWKGKRLVSA